MDVQSICSNHDNILCDMLQRLSEMTGYNSYDLADHLHGLGQPSQVPQNLSQIQKFSIISPAP